jgi:adenosylcobyric acid synthase
MAKAKSIMIQGTMSNAGKSLLTAGLCRVFRQDGYSVAPFKSQNMALNSFITKEGLEMGRAQVVQAEACGIEPSVLMNPVLLKPVTNMGSQVIVNGEVLGNMGAAEYYKIKKRILPEIISAYETLSSQYDIIVLEGAGSPAEINLKDDDMVNMGMARIARSPVLLAGDIDRGGVFAQLYGTLELLDKEEREMVKGLIINKFRGDVEILKPGIELFRQRCSTPVLGVMPFIDVDIDDEDSLSERFVRSGDTGVLDIAVIRLPKISNFTDFAALEATEGVSLRYVRRPAELGHPDMIILPGTKNTISDLLWLRQSGLEAAIKQRASKGCVIFGICGGYQMLGQRIDDPLETEGGGSVEGLGLLPIMTEFHNEKRRVQIGGTVLQAGGVLDGLSGRRVEGYEIHMGRTTHLEGARPLLKLDDGSLDGCWNADVYGCYMHGFFDSEDCRRGIVDSLCEKRGIDPESIRVFDINEYKENQYNLLADAVRNNLDMESIYRILEEGL